MNRSHETLQTSAEPAGRPVAVHSLRDEEITTTLEVRPGRVRRPTLAQANANGTLDQDDSTNARY
jgi:hypothetical protein